MTVPVLPGASIGVLGSGQLGRMFGIAARRMGYRVHVLSPDSDTPAGQVADVEIQAPYDDLDAIRAFASRVAVVTFEFENVPAATTEAAAELVPVRPSGKILHTLQHRAREKTTLAKAGFPVVPFALVNDPASLATGVRDVGTPAVLKTASYGYDGKGQALVSRPEESDRAWASIGRVPAVLEAFVDFTCELSVIVARGVDGRMASFDAIENRHARHILDLSMAPADIPPPVAAEARSLAHAIAEELDLVGLLCVELFLSRDGRLLVNELAPRPHNSGHFTFDACVTSQFEQQLRAVCGLPLGSTAMLAPGAAMANLLGDLWSDGEPDWPAACAFDRVKLHLYGKLEPRPGRKMGHLTATADTPQHARQLVSDARDALVQHARGGQ